MSIKVNIRNTKSRYEYEFINRYTAGIQLLGSEMKSIRQGKADIKQSFCQFENGELYLINSYVEEYSYAKNYGHNERRKRKLLLNKKELIKMNKQVKEKGIAIIPYRLFITKGLAKLEIFTAKGKKIHDKRESIKKRDDKKRMERIIKYR